MDPADHTAGSGQSPPSTGDADLDEALARFDDALSDDADAAGHIRAGNDLLSHLQRRLDDIGGQ